MTHDKHYYFYEEYRGQKCPYSFFRLRIRKGQTDQEAINPNLQKRGRRPKPLEHYQAELKEARSKLKAMKQSMYNTEEWKAIKKQINMLNSNIFHKKSK